MKRIIIAAVAENNAIGKDNDLVWNLPDDMRFFKSKTLGNTVIMGRKNYESIPEKFRPLPKRENIIITLNKNYQAPGCQIFHDLKSAFDHAGKNGAEDVYIIGGAEIYKLALSENLVDEMYITQVHANFDADSFFPKFDPNKWTEEILEKHSKDERHLYPFTITHLRIKVQ